MPSASVTKRDRTRSALLVAVQEVLLESAPASLSVPRIIARAGVSQGTFYNYFDSLEQAVDGVALLVLVEHARLVDAVTHDIEDPAIVVAHSTRLTLMLVATAADYGRLLFDSGLPVDRFIGGLRARMGADVVAGLRSGRFRLDDPDVVLSMASGSILGVALDLHRGLLPAAAIELTTEKLLRDLGLTARAASRVAHLPLEAPSAIPLPLTAVPPHPPGATEVAS
jgi:AcrR family transcriptional regulator